MVLPHAVMITLIAGGECKVIAGGCGHGMWTCSAAMYVNVITSASHEPQSFTSPFSPTSCIYYTSQLKGNIILSVGVSYHRCRKNENQ